MGDYVSDLRDHLQDWIDGLSFSGANKKALLAVFSLVIVFSVVVVARGHSEPVIEPAPIVVAPPKVVVDVAGAVKSPGIYSLPANSRVADAIDAAGGAIKGADSSDINLARIIKDGEQIYVEIMVTTPIRAANSPQRTVRKKSGPININRATAGELDSLPGIGPVLASRIIDYRKANGPFVSVDDLRKVSGIGSAKFAQFKSKVRV